MRALLIRSSGPQTSELIATLVRARFAVDSVETGDDGCEFAVAYDYDVMVIDLDTPDVRWPRLIRRLRDEKVDAPVIVLSGSGAVADKVEALRQGADDYLTKPFHHEELLARVHAVVRRARGHARAVIRTGRLEVDVDAKTVAADGRQLPVTSKEYSILEFLSLRKGAVVSRGALLDHVWGAQDDPDRSNVNVHICRLRKKIAEACGRNYLHTRWGRGFTLSEVPEQDLAA